MDKLSEAVKLAHEKQLSYAQFQKMETLGIACIKHGRLFIEQMKHDRRREDERNGRNTQRKSQTGRQGNIV